MFFILVAACFGIPGFFLFTKASRRRKDGVAFLGWLLFSIGVVYLFVMPLKTLGSYTEQIRDQEDFRQSVACEKILTNKAEALSKQFAYYLAEVYPNHEKEIFTEISPSNIELYLARYPEIKSSATILKLVEEIGDLREDVYDQQIRREKILRDMRYRKLSPWNIRWMIPGIEGLSVPEKLPEKGEKHGLGIKTSDQ